MTDTPDPLPSWLDILDRALALRSEDTDDPIDYNQLVGEELATEEVAELMTVIEEVAKAAAVVRRAVTEELARRMAGEERTSLEVNGYLVTWKPKKTQRIQDVDGFWEYMRANPELLKPGFNPNNLRKTGIPETVFDTFFEMVPGVDPVISTIPMWVIEKIRNEKLRQQEGEEQ